MVHGAAEVGLDHPGQRGTELRLSNTQVLRGEHSRRHRSAAKRGAGKILGQDENDEHLARVQRARRGLLGIERRHRERDAAAQAFENPFGQSHLARRAGRARVEVYDAHPHGAARRFRVHRAGEVEEDENGGDRRRRHEGAAKGRIGANAR